MSDIIPKGWRLVPLKPTKAMIFAGETAMRDAIDSDWDSGGDGESYNSYQTIRSGAQTEIYQAMLAEAPTHYSIVRGILKDD